MNQSYGQGIVVVVVLIAMALLARYASSHSKHDAITGDLILEYGLPLRLISVLVSLLSASVLTLLVYGQLFDNPNNKPTPFPLVLMMLGLLAAGIVLWLETTRVRIFASSRGLRSFSPWHAPRELEWADVYGVSYSSLETCLIFKSRAGKPIKASTYLNGVSHLAAIVIDTFPPDVYRKAAKLYRPLRATRTSRYEDPRAEDVT